MRSTEERPSGLLDLLQRRYGLEFPPHRWERVVEAARLVTGAASVAEASRALAADDALVDALVARVTVGETYFFREPDQFRAIGEELLPDARRRRGDDALRVWSAGCASGEEAYSLAMALVAGGFERARVLATDVSSEALALARRATYGPWSLRGPGAMRALPYLEPRGRAWSVAPRVRALVDVRRLNLAQDAFPAGQDLILCRNVLIYLERGVVADVARRLFEALSPGGWLITASTDPRLSGLAPFEQVVTRAGALYRRPLRPRAAPAIAAEPERPARAARSTRGSRLPSRRRAPPARRGVEGPVVEPTPASPTGPSTRPATPVEAVREVADRGDLDAALRMAEERLRRAPLTADLHFVRGVVLLSLGRPDEAVTALRRAVYLDASLVMAHFSMAIALERVERTDEARRAYLAVQRCCAGAPGDAPLPHADGARAADVAAAAAARLAALGDGGAGATRRPGGGRS